MEEIGKLLNNGYNYSDIAILYRTNAQSRNFEDAILKKIIPIK
jgi:UvrD/REP helicase.